MNEELMKNGSEIVDQLINGLKAIGPDLADLTLSAIHFQGLIWLAVTLVFAIAFVCNAVAVYKFVKWGIPKWNAWDTDPAAGFILVLVLSGVPLIISFITLLTRCTDAVMWASVFDPKLVVALKVINQIGM